MSDSPLSLQPAPAATLPPGIPANFNPAAAKKAGQDFEAFFLSQAFENMFEGLGSDPMFGGGNGEDMYRSMMIQQFSQQAAKSNFTGIADAVTREMLSMQETANKS